LLRIGLLVEVAIRYTAVASCDLSISEWGVADGKWRPLCAKFGVVNVWSNSQLARKIYYYYYYYY